MQDYKNMILTRPITNTDTFPPANLIYQQYWVSVLLSLYQIKVSSDLDMLLILFLTSKQHTRFDFQTEALINDSLGRDNKMEISFWDKLSLLRY
jgi:hypothetical protein